MPKRRVSLEGEGLAGAMGEKKRAEKKKADRWVREREALACGLSPVSSYGACVF